MFGSHDNVIEGNYIGTDASGSQGLGNAVDGIRLDNASGNRIGGSTAHARNVISGQQSSGVSIIGQDATENLIQGNFIGTDATGLNAIANSFAGVIVFGGASLNTVGGVAAGTGNIISGNTIDGVFLAGVGTSGNTIQGNYIGTDATGTAAIPNGSRGIEIQEADNTVVGGDVPGADKVDVRRLQASLDSPEYGISVTTHGFGTVEVRRAYVNDGADEISLGDSSRPEHNDTVVGDPQEVTLSGPGYVNKALDFPSVKVFSSGQGYDTAHFSDLADPSDTRTGVDTFTGRPLFSVLEGPEYRLWARLFDEVHAESRYGQDIANLYGNTNPAAPVNPAELTATAREVQLSGTHSSGSYANSARLFHKVNAFGTSDADKAVLTDTTVDLDSYGPPADVPLDELAQILWLDSFEKIERWNSSTGSKADDIDNIDRSLPGGSDGARLRR